MPPLFAGPLVSQYCLHRADYPPGFLHFFPLSRAKHQTADLESCSKSCPADIIPNPVTDDDDNPDESHKLKHICQAIKLFLYTTGVVRAASHSCGYFPLNSSSLSFSVYMDIVFFLLFYFFFVMIFCPSPFFCEIKRKKVYLSHAVNLLFKSLLHLRPKNTTVAALLPRLLCWHFWWELQRCTKMKK